MLRLPPRNVWRVRGEQKAPQPVTFVSEVESEVVPVRVVIEQDGFVTGWDEGALGFEPHALWFSGDATSFRILVTDLVRPELVTESFLASDVLRVLAEGIALRHPWRTVRLRMILISPIEEYRRDVGRLAAGFRKLKRNRTIVDESEYPPLKPRPGAIVWRSKTNMLPQAGHPGPLGSFLDRTGLLRILASDLDIFTEFKERRRLLRQIAGDEGE